MRGVVGVVFILLLRQFGQTESMAHEILMRFVVCRIFVGSTEAKRQNRPTSDE
jgi:hypothetical protein